MEIPEDQWGTIWKGINHWIGERNISIRFFSSYTAGLQEPYQTDRIRRGIDDGSERITAELLHTSVWVLGLASARTGGGDDNLTDEECIGLLIAPILQNNGDGEL